MQQSRRKTAIWIAAALLFSFLYNLTGTASTQKTGTGQTELALQLYAQAAALMDGDTGRVLYGKNEDTFLPMASTTKIMTCILALELGDLEAEAGVSAYAASMPKVKLSVQKGEHYRLEDLLYALMLESFNDAAVVIAEEIGRKEVPGLRDRDPSEFSTKESKEAVAAFAALMNEKAVRLGCENTWYITPNGLDATERISLSDGTVMEKEHGTTARELALVMSYCVGQSPKKDAFLTITGRKNHTFSANGRTFSLTNHNAFLDMMEGAISGKTGFTNKAGYCYVGALRKDGKTLIVALLACGWPSHRTYKWHDTRLLMEFGLLEYTYREFPTFSFSEKYPNRLEVLEGQPERLGEKSYVKLALFPTDSSAKEGEMLQMQKLLQDSETVSPGTELNGMLMKEGEQAVLRCTMPDTLHAPVREGQIVGKVETVMDGKVYRTQWIKTLKPVEKLDFRWCLERIFDIFRYFCKDWIKNCNSCFASCFFCVILPSSTVDKKQSGRTH